MTPPSRPGSAKEPTHEPRLCRLYRDRAGAGRNTGARAARPCDPLRARRAFADRVDRRRVCPKRGPDLCGGRGHRGAGRRAVLPQQGQRPGGRGRGRMRTLCGAAVVRPSGRCQRSGAGHRGPLRGRPGHHHGHRCPRPLCRGRVGKASQLPCAGTRTHQDCQRETAGRGAGLILVGVSHRRPGSGRGECSTSAGSCRLCPDPLPCRKCPASGSAHRGAGHRVPARDDGRAAGSRLFRLLCRPHAGPAVHRSRRQHRPETERGRASCVLRGAPVGPLVLLY